MYSLVDEDEMAFLPIEIWEKVLLHLLSYSPKAFLRAAKVCVQWRHLAIKICEKICRSKLADNIKDELFETQVTHRYYSLKLRTENEPNGEEWLRMFAHYQETRLISTNQLVPLEDFGSTSIYIEDPFLLLAVHHSSEAETVFKATYVNIYNTLEFFSDEDNVRGVRRSPINPNKLHSPFVIKDEVCDIHFLLLSFPVLLVRTKEFDDCLQWIVVLKDGPYKQPSRGMIDSNSINSKHISTKGSFLLTIDDVTIGKHKLYYASFDEKLLEVKFDLYSTFTVGNPIFASKLLRGHITVNSCDGHILMFELPPHLKEINSSLNKRNLNYHHINYDDSTDTSSSCDRLFKLYASSIFSKDLRYPNKNIFSQDWTFTSTATSSALLYYWHMDRGREYSWLVGLTTQINDDPKETKKMLSLPHSIMLCNIIIGEEITAEVTALIVTRGLLVCGTSKGRVLIYKLQEEAEKENSNLDFLKKAPWINLPMIKKEIRAISVLWTASGLIVSVEDADKHSTLSMLKSTD